MLSFLYGHDEEIVKFVAAFTRNAGGSNTVGPRSCKSIGIVDEDGRLIAGFIYFNYDNDAGVIELGLAAINRRWANRTVYRRLFEYPFIECGCQMLVARVRSDNEPVLSMLARLNFNLTLIPRMYGRDEDGVLCTLTDDQWLDSDVSKKIYRDARREKEAA
jgi:RimJ/RimL family protein N-acetyltransferase